MLQEALGVKLTEKLIMQGRRREEEAGGDLGKVGEVTRGTYHTVIHSLAEKGSLTIDL
jgi:acetylglutamate kinase